MPGCSSCKLNKGNFLRLENFEVEDPSKVKFVILLDQNLSSDKDRVEVYKLFKRIREVSRSNSLFSSDQTLVFSGLPSCGSIVKARLEECFESRLRSELTKLRDPVFICFGTTYKLFQFPFLPGQFSIIREEVSDGSTKTFILLPPTAEVSSRFDDPPYSLDDLVNFLDAAVEIATAESPRSLEIVSNISAKEIWDADKTRRWKDFRKSDLSISYFSLGKFSLEDFDFYFNDVERFKSHFPKSGLVAFDTETQNLRIFKKSTKLNLVSFAWRREDDNRVEVHVLEPNEILRETFEKWDSDALVLVGHNIKFDLKVILRYILKSDIHSAFKFLDKIKILDTLVISHIYDSEQRLSLKALSSMTLQVVDYSSPLSIFASKKKEIFKDQAKAKFRHYSAFDAFSTLLLGERSLDLLSSDRRIATVWGYEEQVLKMATHTEFCGMKVDMGRLVSLREEILSEAREKEKILREEFSLESINKTAEIRKTLIKLKAPLQRKTRKGDFSTDRKTLEIMLDRETSKGTNPKLIRFLELLLDAKRLKKVELAYLNIDTWTSEYLDDAREYTHSTFKLFGTATGRLCLTVDQLDLSQIEFLDSSEDARYSVHFRHANKLLSIKTEEGKIIYCTPEHYFPVDVEGEILLLPAEKLQPGVHKLIARRKRVKIEQLRYLEGDYLVADVCRH